MIDLAPLLASVAPGPVLVDVGASGAPPPLWEPLARWSTYVGFDADARCLEDGASAAYARRLVVNAAVTADRARSRELFFLTRSPYCSSTLPPDDASLQRYLMADLFQVVERREVPCTTLDAALAGAGLDRVDWFKTDSQGTDLRLFNSLAPELRARVLAVDVEPGLIDAYRGEDLFPAVHSDLVAQGFWPARLEVMGRARMMRATLDVAGLDPEAVERAVAPAPCWVEARYLRGIDALAAPGPREWTLLGAFALLDGHLGFALDVARAARERGAPAAGDRLWEVAQTALLRRQRRALAERVVGRAGREARALGRRLLGRWL